MREQFEAWARTRGLNLSGNPRPEKWGYAYYDIETQLYWECWQAARVINVVDP